MRDFPISNEYVMHRDRLLQSANHLEALDPDRLLALILYKNIEVAHFERIRLGKSKLHELLRLSPVFVKVDEASEHSGR